MFVYKRTYFKKAPMKKVAAILSILTCCSCTCFAAPPLPTLSATFIFKKNPGTWSTTSQLTNATCNPPTSSTQTQSFICQVSNVTHHAFVQFKSGTQKEDYVAYSYVPGNDNSPLKRGRLTIGGVGANGTFGTFTMHYKSKWHHQTATVKNSATTIWVTNKLAPTSTTTITK